MAVRETLNLEEVLARCGDGAFVVGPDGAIARWNHGAERILGYAARDVIGKPFGEVYGGRDVDEAMARVRMCEPVQSFDVRARTRAGLPIWLNVSILAGNGTGGAGIVTHLFRDVTETREQLAAVLGRVVPPARPLDGVPALTRRELEVLRLLASGANTKASAHRLAVSHATVRNHVQHLLAKLGVHSRLEAVAYANRHALI